MFKRYKSHPIIVFVGYLLGMFIGMLFGMVVFGIIASKKFDLSVQTVLNILSTTLPSDATKEYIDCYNFMNAWLNLTQYLGMIICVSLASITYLKEDITVISKDKKKFGWSVLFSVIAVLVLILLSSVTDIIIKKINPSVTTSTNQGSLEEMVLNGYAGVIFIAVFFLAPVVEELVFRKSIFKLLKKYKSIVPIIVSSLIFGLMHMLGGESSILIWLVYLLSYSLSGLVLALIYHYSGNNVYASIICHMLNNLVAFILIFF